MSVYAKHSAVWLLLGAALCSGAVAGADWPLQQDLGAHATLEQEAGVAIIEYCPDNTCDRFTAQGAESLQGLHDFVYLHVHEHSQYSYVRAFQAANPAYLARIGQRNTASCPRGQVGSTACVLTLLQRRLGITYATVRYDEGQRCLTPEPLLGVAPSGQPSCGKR